MNWPDATTTIKKNAKQLFATNAKKKLMKSVFAALGNIQATEQNRPSTKKSSPAECQHQSAHAKELLHSAKLHWLPTIEKYPC